MRGLDPLICRRSAHGGLVYVNILGDVAENHRPETPDAAIEKFSLEFEDALADPMEGCLAVVDGLHKPLCCTKFIFQVLAGLFPGVAFLSRQALIQDIEPKFWHVVVSQMDVAISLDNDVGYHKSNVVLLVTARRPGLKGGDHMCGVCHFIDAGPQFA